MKIELLKSRVWMAALWSGILLLLGGGRADASTLLFTNALVHTVANGILTNGAVLVESNVITLVFRGASAGTPPPAIPPGTVWIDVQGRHLYPGLISADSALGLTEIDAVRATQDSTEVGEFTPEVESWIAVNPDSELLPVARANGIGYFEPSPEGDVVAGQSALLALAGWTWEQMIVKKPAALHIFWPDQSLNITPKDRLANPAKWKAFDEQDQDRRNKIRSLEDFFDDARAYIRTEDFGALRAGRASEKIPAWEAMRPYLKGELPVVVHANELRQIQAAALWAATNHLRVVIAGGRDAWRAASLLASHKIPVLYEHIFTLPPGDTDAYDVQFRAPEVLHRAGVCVGFATGRGGFGATMSRNLPYLAAQAVAFGLPEEEAIKGVTLYPARMLGVQSRVGSIEAGKEATLFICDGNILDIRAKVTRFWIAGEEVSLASRHTRLYERYQARPPRAGRGF